MATCEVANPAFKKFKCVIDEVILKTDLRAEPALVTFANGIPLPNEESKIKGRLYQNIQENVPARKRNRMMLVETPKMTYSGVINPKDDDGQVKEDMFLGVYDPTTGKMKLIEMSCFNLQPQLKPITTTNKLLLESVHSRSWDEKQEDVATGFGSKKAKQMVNRRKQYQINAEQMSTAMNRAISAAEVHEEEVDDTLPESYSAVLPPRDKTAARIEDVYKLSEIVNDELLSPLKEQAKQLLSMETKNDTKLNMLMEELLSGIQLEEEEDRRVYLTCVALLIKYLMTFLTIKFKDLKKKSDVIPNCPRQVENMILAGFTEGHGTHRNRTKVMDDKTYCYILVLSLVVNRYTILLTSLRQTLPLDNEKLDLLMRAIGATRLSKQYKLQLPLQKLSKSRRKLNTKKK